MTLRPECWVTAVGRTILNMVQLTHLSLQELAEKLEAKATRLINVVKHPVLAILLEAGQAILLRLPVRATVRVVGGKADLRDHHRVGTELSKVNGLSPSLGLARDGRHHPHGDK